MTRTVRAIVEGDVLRPLDRLPLQDQQIVDLVVTTAEGDLTEPGESFLDAARRIGAIGSAVDLPADLSTNPAHLEGFGRP
jgi:hypothetical protein